MFLGTRRSNNLQSSPLHLPSPCALPHPSTCSWPRSFCPHSCACNSNSCVFVRAISCGSVFAAVFFLFISPTAVRPVADFLAPGCTASLLRPACARVSVSRPRRAWCGGLVVSRRRVYEDSALSTPRPGLGRFINFGSQLAESASAEGPSHSNLSAKRRYAINPTARNFEGFKPAGPAGHFKPRAPAP